MKRSLWLVVWLLSAAGTDVSAQSPDGYVWIGVDALPNVADSPVEVRGRLFVDEQVTPFGQLTLRFAGSLDLLGVRSGSLRLGSGLEFSDLARPENSRPDPTLKDPDLTPMVVTPTVQEGYAEFATGRADVRVGYTRVVWGRLDEVQPTDVINPLDLARFFFDGRSEARLAVPMLRARVFFGERASLDALLVPAFRRGRFDRLRESTSPFNLEPAGVSILRRTPRTTLRNLQGGARVSATTGRVDWSISTYRGFDAYGTYVEQLPSAAVPVFDNIAGSAAAVTSGPPLGAADPLLPRAPLLQVFPRYTMIGGDFETARGEWALRGEVAHRAGDLKMSDGGAGFDRRAGQYHVSGTLLVHHEPGYTSTSLVAAADRSFARERYRARAFGVYDLTERATFLRTITSMEVRQNLGLEGSIGWFFGRSNSLRRDVVGRFSDRDFLYARLKLHF